MRRSALASLALLTAATLPAQAPRPRVSASKVASVEGITEYQLPNGLRILLFPDQSKPTVTVNITYMVGSRFEAYGETGMAHLLEHLQFKGTPTHKDINAEIDKHGARNNASTWDDRTNYFETMPATDANLTWALDLEADRMTHSFIAEKDLRSEMTVVRNEFEMGENDPFSILLERTFSTAYLWHNYGHSTIGARSDIENVPIERLQAFYHKYYQPDNAVLLVAGKFDPAVTLQAIERRFGAIARPVRALSRGNILFPTYTVEPTQDGERTVSLRRVGDVQAVLAVYHVPALSHPDFAAVDVLSSVLGDQPSGRLYQALVVPKLAAGSGAFDFQRKEPGTLVLYAQVRQESSLDSARVALLRTVDSTTLRPPTAEEVERAKVALLKQIDLAMNNSDQVGLWISEWQAAGDWRLLFIHRDRIKQVTVADVQRVASAYLKPSNVTVGLFYPTPKPDRAEIPGAVDIAALVRDYRGDTAFVAGEAFDASPANIDKRSEYTTLPGGLRVSLLAKKTRGGEVYGRLVLHVGDERSLTGQATAQSLAASMLSRGTVGLTRQQLKDSLDRLKARVSAGGGAGSVTVNIETVKASVPAVLTLVADMVRRPRFDAVEFEQLRQEGLADLEQSKSDPFALALTAFDRTMDPHPVGHPFYTPTIEESVTWLTAAKVEESRAFHEAFYGASAADLVLIGDIDTTQVRAAAVRLFDGWKAKNSWTRLADPFQKVAATSTTIETPDKANAVFLAGINVRMSDTTPDYAAMVLANYILGATGSSRLWMRVREHDGLSYDVGSRLRVHTADDGARWRAHAIYAPANADRLLAAFNEEIARIRKDGITAEELKLAQTSWLQDREQQRSNDDELAALIAARREFGRTLTYDAALADRVRSTTVDQVNAALLKYLDPAAFTFVKAGDFAKAKPKP